MNGELTISLTTNTTIFSALYLSCMYNFSDLSTICVAPTFPKSDHRQASRDAR